MLSCWQDTLLCDYWQPQIIGFCDFVIACLHFCRCSAAVISAIRHITLCKQHQRAGLRHSSRRAVYKPYMCIRARYTQNTLHRAFHAQASHVSSWGTQGALRQARVTHHLRCPCWRGTCVCAPHSGNKVKQPCEHIVKLLRIGRCRGSAAADVPGEQQSHHLSSRHLH